MNIKIEIDDEKNFRKEKSKGRKLRQTQWWKEKVSKGICHYCGGVFSPSSLTMDHIVPIARGGRSAKGNVVPSCKKCNTTKKYYTSAEIVLRDKMDVDVKF